MRRAPLILAALGLVLVTALWFLFVISPMNTRIGEFRDQTELAKNEEMTLRATLARLRAIQESELTYIAAAGALQEMIPPTPDLADLVDQLDVLKQETGVRWVSITPGLPAEVEGQTYREIPLSMNIQGQYFEVLGYLYGLAELDRLVVVRSLAVSSGVDDDGFTLLSVNLSGAVFTTGELTPPPEEGEAPPPEEGEAAATTTTVAGDTTTTTGG